MYRVVFDDFKSETDRSFNNYDPPSIGAVVVRSSRSSFGFDASNQGRQSSLLLWCMLSVWMVQHQHRYNMTARWLVASTHFVTSVALCRWGLHRYFDAVALSATNTLKFGTGFWHDTRRQKEIYVSVRCSRNAAINLVWPKHSTCVFDWRELIELIWVTSNLADIMWATHFCHVCLISALDRRFAHIIREFILNIRHTNWQRQANYLYCQVDRLDKVTSFKSIQSCRMPVHPRSSETFALSS